MAGERRENIDCSNEIADSEVRRYANKAAIPRSCIMQSLSNAKRQIRKSKDVAWQWEWENQRQTGAPLLYAELGLNPISKRKKLAPQLGIKQEIVRWLIAAWSGHGHFAAYH